MENRIRQLREEYGITQIRLSIELEVAQETISAYENGKHYPTVKNLIRLAQIFDTSLDYLVGFSEIRKPMQKAELSGGEINLLSLFHRMNELQQEKTASYMQGLLDSETIREFP